MTPVFSSKFLLTLALAGVLAACTTKHPLYQAPVEDRGSSVGKTVAAAPVQEAVAPAAPAVKPPPGAENAGKPGYYTVKPGDTLIRVGLDNGQNWRDLGRWNNLENLNLIEVGQVLRVAPPQAVLPAVAPESGVVTHPVVSASVTALPAASAPQPARVTPAPAAPAPTAAAASAAVAPASAGMVSEEDLAWIWPSSGALLRGFDEVSNKGLDLGGASGDAVLAALDGRVVYAGSGLRGYGNLVILKHNNTYLSAYAHNQTLLVKEDQNVRKGQKIAEMGSSDSDRTKLHFEIRRLGKPVDPAKYLPAR